MNEFVAVRKRSRFESVGLEASSVQQKREFVRDDAQRSQRSQILEKVGLNQLISPGRGDLIKRSDLEGSFLRLGYIGAYIINAKDESQASNAQEILADNYYIVPNTLLDLPSSEKTQIRGSKKKGSNYWPEMTGISNAHGNGIQGNDWCS